MAVVERRFEGIRVDVARHVVGRFRHSRIAVVMADVVGRDAGHVVLVGVGRAVEVPPFEIKRMCVLHRLRSPFSEKSLRFTNTTPGCVPAR